MTFDITSFPKQPLFWKKAKNGFYQITTLREG